MSRRKPKAVYWQDAPMPREQLVLIPTHLEDMIRRIIQFDYWMSS